MSLFIICNVIPQNESFETMYNPVYNFIYPNICSLEWEFVQNGNLFRMETVIFISVLFVRIPIGCKI